MVICFVKFVSLLTRTLDRRKIVCADTPVTGLFGVGNFCQSDTHRSINSGDEIKITSVSLDLSYITLLGV